MFLRKVYLVSKKGMAKITKRISQSELIKAGMALAHQQGIHIGRPRGTEADERFLKKPKSIQVADLMTEHPDWSLRDISRHSGIAINTVCKVAKLVGTVADIRVLTLADMPARAEVPTRSPIITPYMEYTDETVERRNRVIEELQHADDYMVITVSKSDERGRKPIGMHISRLNVIGPALSTLMHQDRDFCEAMGEMVQEARRCRYGL
jgi:hypothetical protein